MKQNIEFTRMLWDSEAKVMREHRFVLTLDTEKLPPKLLRKVKDNKTRAASMAYGGLIIRSNDDVLQGHTS